LTLPTGGLSNAFGPSIFSSSWLSTTNGTATGFSVLDELRSVTSADSGADDFDVHTLDYLGLDDSHRPPPAATISELRNQAQAAIAGNLANPSRMRASTVSNPYRTRPSVPSSLLAAPAAEEEEEYFVETYDALGYDPQHLNAYDIANAQSDFGQSSYLSKGFKTTDHLTTNRPRAISVGILDDPMRSLQRRATAGDAHSYINELSHAPASLANNLGNPSGILKTDKLAPSRVGVSPSVHFPTNGGDIPIGRGASAYLLAPNAHTRSVSPKSEGPSAQLQTPTRSLWIGNLDSAVTSEQLIHVFAPYGAIESLRLLPEKVLI
jgi:protein JSN1